MESLRLQLLLLLLEIMAFCVSMCLTVQSGMTPLMEAAKHGHRKVVAVFLSRCARTSEKNPVSSRGNVFAFPCETRVSFFSSHFARRSWDKSSDYLPQCISILSLSLPQSSLR